MECYYHATGAQRIALKSVVSEFLHCCEVCGHLVWSRYAESWRIHRTCRHVGIGDRIANWLAARGITKQWASEKLFSHTFRYEHLGHGMCIPVVTKTLCGCPNRQEKLNRLGWRLTQFWRREHRLFTVAIVGTTVAVWTVKYLMHFFSH